jgi:hypothetical protein
VRDGYQWRTRVIQGPDWQVYGADNVWKQMSREGIAAVVRCTVERLMCQQGLCCVHRGKVVRTNTPGTAHRGLVSDNSIRTEFLLDAIKQVLYERQPQPSDQLVHYSNREAAICVYSVHRTTG